jgi:hypothetical protein
MTILLIIATCSGVSSLLAAASHDHTADCADCGPDCPGNCDPHSCPPGPLCPFAPHIVVAQPNVIPTVVRALAARATFTIDTRVPPSISAGGIFHPPRCFA